MPQSLQNIGSNVFEGCNKLKEIQLPDKCITIREGAFSGCESLTRISISNTNYNFVSDDGVLYTRNFQSLICYPGGKKDVKYELNPYTKEIKAYSLSNTYLEDLIIPENVKKIDYNAFSGCERLNSIHLRAKNTLNLFFTEESLNGFNYEICTLYVPVGCGLLYRRNRLFSKFKDIIEEYN